MATGSIQPLKVAGTVVIAASTTSANAQLAGAGDSVLVTNLAGAAAFVAFGTDATVTAAQAGIAVPAGQRLLLSVGLYSWAAAVLASGTGNVSFSRGEGSAY
jgi:hypothetical protein